MCGRSSLTKTEKQLEERFKSTFYSEDLERYNPLPNYNVAPTQMHPVITNEDSSHLQFFKWGLIPFWAKDAKIGSRMINARAETVHEKPAYRTALKKRRCIVPLDGFYEWKKTASGKQPYRIHCTNTEIFSVAGLWENWKNPEGTMIQSFTMLTTGPNELMESIHNRMPVILHPEQERLWLDLDLPLKDSLALLNPYPAALMSAYPVDQKVGNVRNNDPSLILPLS